MQELDKDIAAAMAATEQWREFDAHVMVACETSHAVDNFAIAGTDEELTDDQSQLVQAFYDGNKNPQTPEDTVQAVIGTAATESFKDFVAVIGDRVNKTLVDVTSKSILAAEKSLRHYCKLTTTLQKRLLSVRALLVGRGESSEAVNKNFVMDSHKRFLQCAGKSIDKFEDFSKTHETQVALAIHDCIKGVNYSVTIGDRVIKDLRSFSVNGEDFREKLRDSVHFHWKDVWLDGFVVKDPGKVPAEYLKEVSGCRVYPICSLFDARQLVAVEPLKAREAKNVTKYMAEVVFDKKGAIKPSGSFAMPKNKEVIALIDKTLNMLEQMKRYSDLADKYKTYEKETSSLFKELLSKLKDRKKPEDISRFNECLLAAVSCIRMMTTPHVELAWLNIRLALVVISLAEHSVFATQDEMQVTSKFFADAKTPDIDSEKARNEVYAFLLSLAAKTRVI